MIDFKIIRDSYLENTIIEFDKRIDFLKNQFNIELKTYGNLLRVGFNIIQAESFDYILERININRELERALDNAGGYTIDYLQDNNPKAALIKIITYLNNKSLKLNGLIEVLKSDNRKKIVIADTNDIDFLKHQPNIIKTNLMSFVEVTKKELHNEKLIFYSFNGLRDFDLIYNHSSDILLILFEQEYKLYQKQLQKRKQQIEEEIKSSDRFKICDINYIELSELPINLSKTIEDIVDRIDSLGNRAYNGYKDESDLLLDEIEEKIIFRLTSQNNQTYYLDSNDSIFNEHCDLIKAYRIKIGDKIRIYPKEQFAEKLYQVAVETDKDVFGKVEDHSKLWLSQLIELKNKYKNQLYDSLKKNGLRVLPATVDNYFNEKCKFPMYNCDLKAIFKLKYPDKNDLEIDIMLAPIRKSKSTYKSTMIALGRGIKQEIKLFLKEKRVGEILEKLKFNQNTLHLFINQYMPLLTITKKEIYSEETGQLELFNLLDIEL